jgi:hypothetical protein
MSLEEYREENHHFPQEFDINPRVTLVVKLLLLHHFVLGISMSGKLKSRNAAIRAFIRYISNNTSLMSCAKNEELSLLFISCPTLLGAHHRTASIFATPSHV